MADKETVRMAGDYEIMQSFRMGGTTMLIGYNPGDATYMTCYQGYDFLGNERFSEAIGSESYVEIMDVFLQRLQEQTEKVRAFQAERAMPVTVLGREYCLPCSDESLEGKLVIIRPASLAPEYRTASSGMRWVVSAVLPAPADAQFILKNCILAKDAGGTERIFSESLTVKSCPIGPKKKRKSTSSTGLHRKRSEVKKDDRP